MISAVYMAQHSKSQLITNAVVLGNIVPETQKSTFTKGSINIQLYPSPLEKLNLANSYLLYRQ
jgi:hypothetical protein